MEELIELVSERARISEAAARRAIETVFSLVHADEIAIESSQGTEVIDPIGNPISGALDHDVPGLPHSGAVWSTGSTSLH